MRPSAPRSSALLPLAAPLAALVVAGCAQSQRMVDSATGAARTTATTTTTTVVSSATLPAGAAEARARLDRSPRHGEWAMVRVGTSDSVRAWVVYPERATRAPVVLVVHEIFGLSTWVRAVADQLAAEGFIAIAPDLLSGKPVGGNADSLDVQAAMAQIRTLDPAEVQRRLAATAAYGTALPAAMPRYGIVGFCWGGGVSFQHAAFAGANPGAAAGFGGAVVYYGPSPAPAALGTVRAPVLGLYAGDDARVNATVPPADSALRAMGRSFAAETYPGAGHGFLRQQDGRDGANLSATQQAWPRTLGFFRRQLGG